jgi:hypothetical protein
MSIDAELVSQVQLGAALAASWLRDDIEAVTSILGQPVTNELSEGIASLVSLIGAMVVNDCHLSGPDVHRQVADVLKSWCGEFSKEQA